MLNCVIERPHAKLKIRATKALVFYNINLPAESERYCPCNQTQTAGLCDTQWSPQQNENKIKNELK